MSLGEPSHGPKHDGYLVCLLQSQETLSLLDNVDYFFNECIYKVLS